MTTVVVACALTVMFAWTALLVVLDWRSRPPRPRADLDALGRAVGRVKAVPAPDLSERGDNPDGRAPAPRGWGR